MDIGIVIPELKKHGGAERFLIECLARWQHLHDITVYAAEFDENLLAESSVFNLTLKTLSPQFEGTHAILLNSVLLPKIWKSEIGKHDIYHTHLWPTHLIDLHPMVWYPHEPVRVLHDLKFAQEDVGSAEEMQKKLHFYPKQSYDTIYEDHFQATLEAIQGVDATVRPERIVANSKYSARYLEQVYAVEVPDVVYPGINADDFFSLPNDGNIVLTIGQLWPHKRIRLIVEAIAMVEGVQLYVVGSGPEKPALTKIAEHLGVADRVFFLHGLSNHEVRILLARCMCVAFMPMREPFGIVALEALASGKPLIAANEGGYIEVVDRASALLVPPRPHAIAEKIQYIQSHPSEAAAMGEHGRKLVKDFKWDRTAGELLSIIEEVAQSARQAQTDQKSAMPDTGPRIAVHYFNWYQQGYGSAHWCDNPETSWVNERPELGYYSSQDGDTLNAHIDEIEGAEIDTVIFNLHVDEFGLSAFQLQSALRFVEIAAKRSSPLEFMVNLCIYTHDQDLVSAAIKIIKRLFSHLSGYVRIEGKPALMIFWSGVFDGDSATVSHLAENCSGFFRIGAYTRRIQAHGEALQSLGLFHAISQFSPLELSEESKWEQVWATQYQLSAQNSQHHFVTVSPGFDDTSLASANRLNNQRLVPRNGIETYKRCWDFVAQQDAPSFVIITSFNEFHENSHIEPTLEQGHTYLDATRDFVRAARKRWQAEGFSKPAQQVHAT